MKGNEGKSNGKSMFECDETWPVLVLEHIVSQGVSLWRLRSKQGA